MKYFDTYEQASKFAKLALDRMITLGVPPNPKNFTVWFAYFTKQHGDLNRLIDDMIADNQNLTPDHVERINEVFYGPDQAGEALRETSAKIQGAVSQVLDFIAKAGDETAQYGQALQDFSGQIAEDGGIDGIDGIDGIRDLVGTLIEDTRHMEEHSRQVQSKLATSTEEITTLRQDIESIRQESLTDGLTGIANRRSFDETLRQLADEAMAEGDDLCLLMCDIDHFKKFNDTWGHPLGDQVLRLVARTLVECIKGRDVAARYGGEEFTVILPQTELKNAVTLAQHIRSALATKKVVNRKTGKELGTVTISIGAALYRPGEPLAELIVRADAALYAAKAAGRNRVMAEAAPAVAVA